MRKLRACGRCPRSWWACQHRALELNDNDDSTSLTRKVALLVPRARSAGAR